MHIGCHLSSSKGFAAMGRQALELGADTFQFFTRNPRGSRAKDLDEADAAALTALMAEHRFAPVVAHAPYTLNLCGAREENRAFALETMADDLRRLEHLPGQLYNFHPGSHVGQGEETGTALIAAGLNALLQPDQSTTVLLETMSGKGSEVGGSFEALRAILDRVELGEKVGVCLDTCHVWDAGYDIAADLDGVLAEFDRVIGLDRLRAIHLNDSKNPLGSRKDRHACIGEGCIGLEALVRVVRHPALRDLPFCLETPNDLAGYAREIALLRRAAED
ncbi:deoxyribonuclease IV [Dysosmobacter sp.]|uniref:deoxyribonuclease IV n=1 Tax=Dysosmobacter sp. TaxID=2591382 RepID=UPI002A97C7C4|nr:deoxyribonuclease IV [Dysosmobacter sp.]MCI6054922.1 deoxyribonuclease IV [Dysosmobacter sp.]MDY5510850.1 deoxyribonuclease IV [Dysosmobacter sp.]